VLQRSALRIVPTAFLANAVDDVCSLPVRHSARLATESCDTDDGHLRGSQACCRPQESKNFLKCQGMLLGGESSSFRQPSVDLSSMLRSATRWRCVASTVACKSAFATLSHNNSKLWTGHRLPSPGFSHQALGSSVLTRRPRGRPHIADHDWHVAPITCPSSLWQRPTESDSVGRIATKSKKCPHLDSNQEPTD
jgi:hypothetical protein